MGEVVTTIEPGEDHWSTTLVGDNAERGEALAQFESFEDYAASNEALANKDWRAELAGDDGKFLSTLQRYSAPADLGNAFREQKQMISAGNMKAQPGPDATEDDINAYRESNGIPLEATGYLENLPEGLVIGDDDKEIFADFMGALHAKNARPETAHAAIEWYNSFAEQQQDLQAETDGTQSQETTDLLRTDWGSDYRANINLVTGIIENTFGKEAKDQLMNGRYADGRAFMNDPEVLKGFAEMARKLNPIMQITPPGTDPTQTLNDEIAEIEKFMAENRTEYNKDETKQTRLRQLYQIRIDQSAAA